MRNWWVGSLLLASALAPVASGCGKAADDAMYIDPSATFDAATSSDAGQSGSLLNQPTCAQLAGQSCGCTDVSPISAQPTLYFVLDDSSSMAGNNKWKTVRSVVGQIAQKIGARAYFGATVFPGPDGAHDYCETGTEVFPRTLGDATAANDGGTADGGTTSALLAQLDRSPAGSTPTAATLTALVPKLGAIPGPTYVILATDGAPNCAQDVPTCAPADCTTNIESSATGCTPTSTSCCQASAGKSIYCVDQDGSVGAVQKLADAKIPTYVVGITHEPRYLTILDAMAQAGGTARATEPYFYDVASDDASAIEAALLQVAAAIVGSCTITLDTAPSDPALVNVLLDGTPLAPDPINGWSISGQTVTLLGSACQSVESGQVLDVRVISGCPTVVR